jgi:hypothetical protein
MKRRFLQQLHGVTSQKMPFFIVSDLMVRVFAEGLPHPKLRAGHPRAGPWAYHIHCLKHVPRKCFKKVPTSCYSSFMMLILGTCTSSKTNHGDYYAPITQGSSCLCWSVLSSNYSTPSFRLRSAGCSTHSGPRNAAHCITREAQWIYFTNWHHDTFSRVYVGHFVPLLQRTPQYVSLHLTRADATSINNSAEQGVSWQADRHSASPTAVLYVPHYLATADATSLNNYAEQGVSWQADRHSAIPTALLHTAVFTTYRY